MVLSDYSNKRILSLYWKGYKIAAIAECLGLEGIKISKQGICQFLKRYDKQLQESLARNYLSNSHLRSSKLLKMLYMRKDDETTVTQLEAKLASHEIYVPLATCVAGNNCAGFTMDLRILSTDTPRK